MSANRVYESSGPEGKVRGTPQQIVDKYLALARDRSTAGDRVMAENFLQHAEHYMRILAAAQPQQPQNRREDPREDGLEDERSDDARAEHAARRSDAAIDDAAEGGRREAAERRPVAEGMAVIGEDEPAAASSDAPDAEQPKRKPRRSVRRPRAEAADEMSDEPAQETSRDAADETQPARRPRRRTRAAEEAPEPEPAELPGLGG